MTKLAPIIIVEDDPDDQHFLECSIRSTGFKNELKIFPDGHTALDYLSSTADHPFIILCDINMPVMDGLELRRRINDDPFLKQKSIPFIFLSTSDEPGHVRLAYKMTIQGFFKKPPSVRELSEMVLQILLYWQACRHPNTQD